eukprot:TRINITY_DN5795_c1_g2_i1.p1 TRINITY_DN5795_c1_g2~~TRINITY_DN5795_c1_g2_i1.p1  ORF type:complete len:221 (+),score=73.01 TRINITY_DN5795_c1_g2_i1:90-665(+)
MAPRRLSIEVAVAASACLLAGTAFVTGRQPQGSPEAGLRSLQGGRAVEFQQFRMAESAEPATSWTWSSVLAMAVAFGLVVGVVQPSARADDVGEYRAANTKSLRASNKRKEKLQEEKKAEEKAAPTPAAKPKEAPIKADVRKFVNPSDELDEDEIPFEDWSAEHPVQLILTGLIPTFIYLTFYILGSLEII